MSAAGGIMGISILIWAFTIQYERYKRRLTMTVARSNSFATVS